MSTDKTLADVQPGGRVRLGDQASAQGCDELRMRTDGERAAYLEGVAEGRRAVLSAQPSPGGQGDAREREGWRKMQKAAASQTRKDGVGACDALYELAVKHGANDAEAAGVAHHVNGSLALLETQTHDGLHREATMEAALAARQPVGEDWQHIANEWADATANGVQWLRNIRDGASTVADALACMESNVERIQQIKPQPVGEPVAYTDGNEFACAAEYATMRDLGHDGSGWRPLYADPPAQAVDLEQFRPAVCAMGLYAEEPEDVDEAKRLLALIDSRAVGNG